MLEIEKTFLVKKTPADLTKYRSIKIKQGYLSDPPSPLRIRQKGDKYELTKKLPLKEGDFSSAEETNIDLREDEFKKLCPLVIKSLEKTRYLIPLEGGLTAELDIFEGRLAGLSFVEVEFKSEEEMNNFTPPDWFGVDVTQEDFSANVFLAGKTADEVNQIIASRGL